MKLKFLVADPLCLLRSVMAMMKALLRTESPEQFQSQKREEEEERERGLVVCLLYISLSFCDADADDEVCVSDLVSGFT